MKIPPQHPPRRQICLWQDAFPITDELKSLRKCNCTAELPVTADGRKPYTNSTLLRTVHIKYKTYPQSNPVHKIEKKPTAKHFLKC